MGFRISWIGFDGTGKTGALDAAGLRDTGELQVTNEAPFSGGEMSNGWFIVFSNDFGYASPERLARVSVDCRVVGCQVHEGIMVTAAYEYRRGQRVWEMTHQSQNGINDLSVIGSPPPSFEAIRRRLMQEQEAAAGDDVDYVFDIPVEVAASVCNYRHDRWGLVRFTRLELR